MSCACPAHRPQKRTPNVALERVALAAEDVLGAVEPADVAAPLVRCESLRVDLLLSRRDAFFQRWPFLIRRATPREQGTSLLGGQDATRQLPAMQILLKLFLRMGFGGLCHCVAFEYPSRARSNHVEGASRVDGGTCRQVAGP